MGVLAISSPCHRLSWGSLLGCGGVNRFGAVGKEVKHKINRGPEGRLGCWVEKAASV